jgi:aminoglycoside phosphotransferase (APT) family kinase protein
MSGFEHFVGTRAVSEGHAFDTAALSAWLAVHVAGFAGPLTVEMFNGGQSNPTYKLITPAQTYVMRAKPGPVTRLLPSAHAVEREFAVMRGLAGTGVPVAKMHALCEDESVIGRAFYIMEFVDGRVLWDQALPGMSPSERGDIYREMNRVQATLHTVDFAAQGLSNYGKPGNFFERQIGRWTKQYLASVTQPQTAAEPPQGVLHYRGGLIEAKFGDPIPEMDRLIEWLPANIPQSGLDESKVSIVHGDYRLDNLIFHPSEPRVLAVLDWELSTLGHPLADFSYHCMAWHIPPGAFRGIGGLDHAALGIPSEAEYIRLYCERTGLATPEQLKADWNFYLAYNLFRLAAILQGIAKRIETGTASSAQAISSAAGARPLAQLGWRFAQAA